MRRLLVICGAFLMLGIGLVWFNPPAWGLGAIIFDGPQHGGGGGGISEVAHTTAAALDSPTTSPGINTGTSTLIVMNVSGAGGGTVADSKSNTWQHTCSFTDHTGCVWYVYSPTTDSSHTFSYNNNSVATSIQVIAFKGTSGAAVDQSAQADAGAGTTCQAGSITPGHNNEVVVAGFWASVDGGGATYSIGSSYSSPYFNPFNTGVNYGGGISYKVQTTAAATNPTWTNSGSSVDQVCGLYSFQ